MLSRSLLAVYENRYALTKNVVDRQARTLRVRQLVRNCRGRRKWVRIVLQQIWFGRYIRGVRFNRRSDPANHQGCPSDVIVFMDLTYRIVRIDHGIDPDSVAVKPIRQIDSPACRNDCPPSCLYYR